MSFCHFRTMFSGLTFPPCSDWRVSFTASISIDPAPSCPQSYGSRYVRPPIITSDVLWIGPMTVREWEVAQAAVTTAAFDGSGRRPVKGMLTGPITVSATPLYCWAAT